MSLQLLNLPAPPAVSKKTAMLPLGAPYSLGTLASLMTGVMSATGQAVTPARAMRAAAVLACIRILSEDLSALPLNLYRRTPQGAQLATDDPRFRLLHDSPNPWQTSMEAREALILDVLCFGQSFAEKVIGPDGITELHPLAAGRMVPANPLDLYIPPPVPLFWRYADPRTGQRILLSDDLWTVKMLAPAGYLEGQSLILLAREAIGLALAAEEQGARLFKYGVQSDFVLESGADAEPMDKDAKEQLRQTFMARHSGASNAFMPMLLEGGLTAKRIGLTAQESQYIEARNFQLQDIARIFRIPEVLLGVSQGKTATFASAEQFFLSYTKHTLRPWCERIEQSIHRDLLAPSETDLFVRHDLNALMRADMQTRYASYASAINAGWMTRNECREAEHMVTLPGLDAPLQPLNMSGTDNLKPAVGSGAKLAAQLARNVFGHEQKLLADGKGAAEIYTRLLPPYLVSKTGLSAAQVAAYCQARLDQPDSNGAALLEKFLLE